MVVRGRHWQPEDLSDLRVGVVHRLQEEDDTRPIDADLITYLPVYAREKSSSWIYFDSVWAQSYVDLGLKRIHGTFELPEGYAFAVVPRDAILVPKANARDGRNSTNDISASISIPKAVASMVQIVSAFVALQSHRSDLISRWGYASYHLAVIPYLIMTLVNLIGNICIADYPCLYMVRTDIMNEAEKVGGIFEGEVAHTIALMDTCDDLVEDLPYCGVTNEDIISLATSFPPSMVTFWQFSLVLHILAIFFYILGKAEPQISTTSKSMAVDLHVSRTPRNLHTEQLSAVSDATPTVSDEQRNQSSEGDSNLPGRGEAEHEIEMLAADVCNFEDEPEVRFVEAVSSSRRYRIRICSPSKNLRVYGVYNYIRSAMDDRAKRSRRPARCASQSTSMTLVRVLHLWLQKCGAPRQILNLIRKHSSFGEHESVPADLTKFYYPNCSRFLRASSPNHHMISGTGISQDGPPPTLTSEHHMRIQKSNLDPHPQWGVLLEVVVGLFVVGLLFCIVAALTRFQPGQSSRIERVIMMAWLASGLYGFCLPLMSTPELLRVFFLLPLVSILGPALSTRDLRTSFKQIREMKPKGPFIKLSLWYLRDMVCQSSGIDPILSFIPLAIFVPPIWGFVLVGRMLVEWGNCTRLF